MSEDVAEVEIPRRALFKASEVCELVKVQPYVLRSWEAEFPGLGVSKSDAGPRIYRRADVEQVVRIKRLLLEEGLTLAGARRRLEAESPLQGADDLAIEELFSRSVRERLSEVKQGLRSILELLAQGPAEAVRAAPPGRRAPARPARERRAKSPRGVPRAGRSARRKRSS